MLGKLQFRWTGPFWVTKEFNGSYQIGTLAGELLSKWVNGFVGNEAVNAEDHTAICGGEEPAYRGSKVEYSQREREREREAQRVSLLRMQQLQHMNNQSLQKVTKSLYIVTNLGQLPFMLFT